ncbi:type I-E CRISPR-associated protein Cse2/CasB [Methanocella sp. CWC-04]|uniref:Type I-E CRISPR-associated protein Cse2/CasB n=1 Tax=Methanooceanicella nereidis TaxID=2052831 RepID=A0AAP2W622_9EURY|nr:type I-E CRISPR-associated protein Cse2/CasB [Methanocella sp. CWC-04]MCD1294792.1 type I-E CRISPR-associated protein Cse2/CasB [Methanocella sp. CWC-04]
MKAYYEKQEQQKPDRNEEFLQRLSSVDRGDLAVLKRNAGNTIAESRGAMKAFYNILPYGIADSPNEEVFFIVATLYGHNKYHFDGDFGLTMKRLKERAGSESIDSRMAALLDSEFDIVDGFKPGGGELAYRIRQCVKLAGSHEIGVDWLRLLQDLKFWNNPEKKVQKRWARSYFGYGKPAENNDQSINKEVKV